jgi:RHS repeat-associated protein
MERLYLGGDAYSAPAVYVKEAGNWKIYYICRDYLGSITHVINADGSLKQELSYDPWGRLRNPATQQVYAVGSEPTLFLGRGYTGHEHLTAFGLINMNARLYDPAVGRFLSPDPYVQAPDFTQNFNRYSYCLNNPLRYTDPSGELTWNDVIAGISLIGGIILEFVPGMEWLGTSLIVAGFSHFAYTINYVQNNESMSWNDASNLAGFQFSTTISINKTTEKEKKGGKIPPKTQEGDGRFFQGNYYEASQLLSHVSRQDGVERMMYETDRGYYFEEPNGYLFNDLSNVVGMNTKNTFWGIREDGGAIYYVQSTINGTYPFSIEQHNQYLYLVLGMGERFNIYGVYHTHPGNTMLSLDDAFQNMNGICVKAIGWDGYSRGSYFDNNTYYIPEILVKP